IEAYSHQDLPFEKLVSSLRPERDASRSPLFQVMFVVQNAPAAALDATDLRLTPLELTTGTSKFDLTLFATELAGDLSLRAEYSTDLFEVATIDRMLAHYGILLEQVVAEPDRPLSALRMLTEDEQLRLLGRSPDVSETEIASAFDGPDGDDLDALP